MPRRVSLPGASELFRSTGGAQEDQAEIAPAELVAPAPPTRGAGSGPAPDPGAEPERLAGGTGRVRHDEKITVYVSADELLALEQARLTIRARYRKAVDRGRIVRLAVAAALADLEANGVDSELMRRLDRS